ncbi:hypothetical protein FE772_09845 [Lysobacter enzymogenes]|nr:hypothetical protein [Lysobacter enzymogenes]QCW25921.1 hypothetical protein FE772_09845 [Lysobacter enzymogenes]
MIALADLRADLKSCSEKISDLAKTIALSVLATAWVLFLGGKDAPIFPVAIDKTLLFLCGLISISSLIVGYFQFVFGYASAKDVHDKAEAAGLKETEFRTESVFYRLRGWCFWLKQVLVGLSVLILFVAVAKSLLGTFVCSSAVGP